MKPRPATSNRRPTRTFAFLDRLARIDRFLLIVLGAAFLGAALIVVFALQFEQIFPRYNLADFKPAGTAPYELVPDRDIVWVDEDKTAKKRDEAERGALPVFQYDEESDKVIREKMRILKDFLSSPKTNGTNGSDQKKALLHQNVGMGKLLSERSLAALRALPGPERGELLASAETLLDKALVTGIVSWSGIDRDPISFKTIAITRGSGNTRITTEKSMDEILTLQSLPLWLEGELGTLKLPERAKDHLPGIVLALADENVKFSAAATAVSRKKARDNVIPVQEIMRKHYPIIPKGQPITNEGYSKVLAFRTSAAADLVSRMTSTLLFLALIFLTAVFLLGRTLSGRTFARGEILFLVIMGLLYLSLGVLFYRLLPVEGAPPISLFLPTAMVTVIATIIFSPFAGLACSFLLAATALLVQNELPVFLFAFFSGMAGTAAVVRAQKRIDLIKAGFGLFFVQGLLMFVISVMGASAWESVLALSFGAGLNGFFSLIAGLGFLPLIEHALNAPTRFRLMELSDTNVPILKKMLVLAPGTYTHSINVANLAESAATAVGANAPLSRVGAYYHDIGKIDQPEYFIENQAALNKHDFLKPSLSAAVIKSHLKISVEKAKELDLPQAVIDVIAQHHGKGLISYFFSRAKAESEDGAPVSPEDYSYQGTRPRTREAAIVMLADAVEAASRSLKKPTPAKIEKLVRQIIEERYHTEELMECSLTLRDLETITQVFVSIVQGYLHQRIEYPKLKENGA